MKRRLFFSLGLATLVAMLVAACGGDSGTATTQPQATQAQATQVQATQIAATPTQAGMSEAAKFGGTLRVVSQASVESLDMSFTGAWVTTVIAAHLWDRLFEPASDYSVHPQMVDTWTVSSDGSSWTFTLRDGLKFHDGSNVTSADVIPSLKRIWVTQAHGQLMDANLAPDGARVIDNKTFSLTFNRPVGFVAEGLAAPWPFSNIYPKRVMDAFPAQSDHGRENAIGSGPYKLKTWERGNRIILERFDDYIKRSDPADNLAGAKHAYLDEIIWL
ncbi:MAG: hypothetical protein FJ317_00720, partial [SAR202 cluster bacterium]|nr:hypothetical protein [SAR202 cluster bacterium]